MLININLLSSLFFHFYSFDNDDKLIRPKCNVTECVVSENRIIIVIIIGNVERSIWIQKNYILNLYITKTAFL
jgi:hypothetical protein